MYIGFPANKLSCIKSSWTLFFIFLFFHLTLKKNPQRKNITKYIEPSKHQFLLGINESRVFKQRQGFFSMFWSCIRLKLFPECLRKWGDRKRFFFLTPKERDTIRQLSWVINIRSSVSTPPPLEERYSFAAYFYCNLFWFSMSLSCFNSFDVYSSLRSKLMQLREEFDVT